MTTEATVEDVLRQHRLLRALRASWTKMQVRQFPPSSLRIHLASIRVGLMAGNEPDVEAELNAMEVRCLLKLDAVAQEDRQVAGEFVEALPA